MRSRASTYSNWRITIDLTHCPDEFFPGVMHDAVLSVIDRFSTVGFEWDAEELD